MGGTGVTSRATVETEHFGAIAVRHRNCPLCARDNDRIPPSGYSYDPWTIKECPSCDFVYIDGAPHHDVQFETMAWEKTTKVEEKRRAELRPISYKTSKRTRFRMHLLPKRTMLAYIAARIEGGNVLDLGCGDGHALLGFPDSFTPFGIEISSALATAADSRFPSPGAGTRSTRLVSKVCAVFPRGSLRQPRCALISSMSRIRCPCWRICNASWRRMASRW